MFFIFESGNKLDKEYKLLLIIEEHNFKFKNIVRTFKFNKFYYSMLVREVVNTSTPA